MGNEILIAIVVAFFAVAVTAAWVGGYLDKYQKQAQDAALDAMGENRASYGLKSTLKGQKLSEDKDLTQLQEDTADTAGSLVGKGGIGESIGQGLSQGL